MSQEPILQSDVGREAPRAQADRDYRTMPEGVRQAGGVPPRLSELEAVTMEMENDPAKRVCIGEIHIIVYQNHPPSFEFIPPVDEVMVGPLAKKLAESHFNRAYNSYIRSAREKQAAAEAAKEAEKQRLLNELKGHEQEFQDFLKQKEEHTNE